MQSKLHVSSTSLVFNPAKIMVSVQAGCCQKGQVENFKNQTKKNVVVILGEQVRGDMEHNEAHKRVFSFMFCVRFVSGLCQCWFGIGCCTGGGGAGSGCTS